MFASTRSNTRRIAVSAAGALLFSGICIGGVVAPAQAQAGAPAKPVAPAATLAAWTQDTAHRIDTDLAVDARLLTTVAGNVQIGVTVQPDGTIVSPMLLQSSGHRRLDQALIRRARTMTLAALPIGQSGARSVVLRVPLQAGGAWATVNWPVAARYARR